MLSFTVQHPNSLGVKICMHSRLHDASAIRTTKERIMDNLG